MSFEFLVGLLTAEVNLKNIKLFLVFLVERLGNKPLKLKVKAKDIEVKIEVRSQAEFLTIEKLVEDFLQKLKQNDSVESDITTQAALTYSVLLAVPPEGIMVGSELEVTIYLGTRYLGNSCTMVNGF
ncbi:MAG TPA: hypothetical protein DDW76_04070 [Cyanobacteria bacterium UBA11369]|nr:hypothetical protein [Cyanobacteria bacterium UBA11371]HBE31071.1 hypothetical protein [Cyanobacteria bacterium UBA11368]HBE47986.1 hypothetical protein [Cyanobacteria bacterium UBA11369]